VVGKSKGIEGHLTIPSSNMERQYFDTGATPTYASDHNPQNDDVTDETVLYIEFTENTFGVHREHIRSTQM
jgi:hypothetical protein